MSQFLLLFTVSVGSCPPTNPLPNHLPGLSLPQPTTRLLSIFMHPPILDASLNGILHSVVLSVWLRH